MQVKSNYYYYFFYYRTKLLSNPLIIDIKLNLICIVGLPYRPEFWSKNSNVRNFGMQYIVFQNSDMKLVCLIAGRILKNSSSSEDFFFGLHPRTPDNFIFSAPQKFELVRCVCPKFRIFRYGNPNLS